MIAVGPWAVCRRKTPEASQTPLGLGHVQVGGYRYMSLIYPL